MSGPQVPADASEPGNDEPVAGEPGNDEPFAGETEDDELDGFASEVAEELMAGFRRTSQGVTARFTSAQAGIVRNLVGQMAELVGGPGAAAGAPDSPTDRGGPGEPGFLEDVVSAFGSGDSASPPEDPVLARLFPDAYGGDDPDAAGDFRRYTESGLRSGKVAAARTVLATLPDSGGRIRLSAGDAEVWLRALNDVRLALGVILGITEDYERELADDVAGNDPRSAYLQVYDWLTFLQETLVRSLR